MYQAWSLRGVSTQQANPLTIRANQCRQILPSLGRRSPRSTGRLAATPGQPVIFGVYSMTLKELMPLAKAANIRGRWRMRKAQLVAALEAHKAELERIERIRKTPLSEGRPKGWQFDLEELIAAA